MRAALGVCMVALGLLAGCRPHARIAYTPRQPVPSIGSAAVELPLVQAGQLEPGLESLNKTAERHIASLEKRPYRRVTEPQCQLLAARNTALANTLDEEGTTARDCNTSAESLKQTVRFHLALELRNRAAADALNRFYDLAAVEAGTDFLRQAFPILDDLIAKAKAARAANVRFPFDPADLERQRTQLLSQLEQAEAGSELINIELKNRLGLPPDCEHLWPGGVFNIDTAPANREQEAAAALADRPELRALRAVYANLNADTLPTARELLRTGSPLLGAAAPPSLPRIGLARFIQKKRGPDAETRAEVEMRRKQLAELIAARERIVADESRAAAAALNAQTRRVQLARDRLDSWNAKLAEVKKQREANQPGAELLESQVTLEVLRARAETVSEVMAWHQARVRLKAAKGWLAWECLSAGR